LTEIRDAYIESYETALQMIDEKRGVNTILSFLTKAAEKCAGADTVSSILFLDSNGLLRNGASPRLPKDYLAAIDGLKPNPKIGTCAAAAATGLMVVTEDFYADTKWAELRHLPLALGFKGAWSLPIISEQGKVLGTFGTYYSKKRTPTPVEIEGVGWLARAAAMALNK
jgi:GAF domain-containing protein